MAQKTFATIWLAIILLQPSPVLASDSLTILSFNLWGGGLNENKPLTQTLKIIRSVQADLIGLQETRAESRPCTELYCPPRGPSVVVELARELGYYVYQQEPANDALWANAILSRFPILASTPNHLGVRIDIHGRSVYLFNIHPTDYPYQPYQLLGIEYGAAPYVTTADAAIRYAHRARSGALELLRQDMDTAIDAELVVLTGDFNEPSHRDWTPAAMVAGLHPLAVDWPLTRALETAGFIDTYRTAFPDEVAKPGFTWSPLITAEEESDHRDRIDFVFVRGRNVTVERARVVGENAVNADLVFSPWPSDHRAVVTRIRF